MYSELILKGTHGIPNAGHGGPPFTEKTGESCYSKGKKLSRSSSVCLLFQYTSRIKWPEAAGLTEDGCFPNLSQKNLGFA